MEIIEYVHIFQQIKSLLQSKPIKIVCSSHYRHSKLKWCCLKVLLKHNVIYIIYSRMKNIVQSIIELNPKSVIIKQKSKFNFNIQIPFQENNQNCVKILTDNNILLFNNVKHNIVQNYELKKNQISYKLNNNNNKQWFDFIKNTPRITITYSDFFSELNKHLKNNKTIAEFLLDQHIFFGLGDYLISESLHKCNIKPHTILDQLSTNDIKNIYQSIINTLKHSYNLDGTGYDINGEIGEFSSCFQVYQKENAKIYKYCDHNIYYYDAN